MQPEKKRGKCPFEQPYEKSARHEWIHTLEPRPSTMIVRAMIDSCTFQNIPQHSAAISELMCNVHLALLASYGQVLEGGWKNEAAVGSE